MKHPIAKYLMCAYAYYVEDKPLISDNEFDELSKYLLKNREKYKGHVHYDLVTVGDLEAGTYLGKYPTRVVNAVKDYRKKIEKK